MPKKEKSPRAERRGVVDGRKKESISSKRQNEPLKIRPLVASPSIPRVSRFFIFRYLLVVPARGWGIALRPIPLPFRSSVSLREARCEEDTKISRRLGGGRETACLCGAPRSLVPTSRFAFYIIFILLHFSQDKCLRGFASRLGKYFHNVLLCRPPPPRLSSSRFALPRAFGFFPRSRTRNRGIK